MKIRWRMPVGLGLSSPIVAKGGVFLTDVQLTRPVTKDACYASRPSSGKPLWTYSYDAEYPDTDPMNIRKVPFPRPFVTREGLLDRQD